MSQGSTPKMGKLIVIVGPMYSGKTTELLSYVEIYRLGRKRFKIFKPSIDDRYGVQTIRSHSGMEEKAISVKSAADAFSYLEEEQAVFFDEIQFFEPALAEVAKELQRRGMDVICAGLDLSFKQNPFDTTARMLCLAGEVVKKRAVCHECGEYNGVISFKLSDNQSEIDVGGMEKYVAVCLDCYDKLQKKRG
ncbi:MAG TPA: thymidine kinase [Thermotogota bacterium]|nr:thymidine kinase [Thermotogota bacterium]